LGKPVAPADFSALVKELKAVAKTLDTHLQGKQWIAGDSFSLADLYTGAFFVASFQTVLDGGFRKAVPNLAAWFANFIAHQPVIRRMGRIQLCAKALKPATTGGPPPGAAAAPKAPAAAPKKEEKPAADDDLDLFGDDDDDGAAAKAAAEAAKKSKKPKKKAVAMSLVMLEVKPLDDTINLDDVAKKILSTLTQDGLFWKQEYRKEPVAFGIFKLIVGFSLEDEKVSVDDVVERIEALADMVQSVEIQAFNKI